MDNAISIRGADEIMAIVAGDLGSISPPNSWLNFYSLEDAEHPLKGLLRDKGAGELIQELERAIEHYVSVARILSDMVRDANAAHPSRGLLCLSIYKDITIHWRSCALLDRMIGTHKQNRLNFFNPECRFYEKATQAIREHAPDLFAFYRAVDTLRSDLDLRLAASRSLLKQVNNAHELIMMEPQLKVKERDQLANVLVELNRRINTALT